MNKKLFDIPVLLITFNRPETTCHVLEQIRRLKPKTLYIFSDAPRSDRPGEEELVNACRSLFDKSQINWECDFQTWYPDTNLGCAAGVSSAISWAFESSEKVIILEDDCLPNATFFNFCKNMLEKYEDNERIMHVSGTRWNEEYKVNNGDHFFSLIGHIWGWATWKRAWNKYDYHMEQLNSLKDERKLEMLFNDRKIARYWYERFDETDGQSRKGTWDYQWQYSLFINDGLAVVPNVNLISNIGLEGVHYDGKLTEHHFCKTEDWNTLDLPVEVNINSGYEKYHANTRFLKKGPMRNRIAKRIKMIFGQHA